MTCGAGRRTRVAPQRERFMVDARAVLCELIRGNGVSLHVVRVGMAASARVRHVERINRRARIARRSYVVHTMTIRAHRNLGITSRKALAVHTGVVLV